MSTESTIFQEDITISSNDQQDFKGNFFINSSCSDDDHNLYCSLINKHPLYTRWNNFTLSIEQAIKLRDILDNHIKDKI